MIIFNKIANKKKKIAEIAQARSATAAVAAKK